MTEKQDHLATIYERLHTHFLSQRFAELCRVALSSGFLAHGMTKVLGMRFTTLGLDNPVGFFFESLYRAQPYWQFLGWFQVLAAVLIMIPRFSYLGTMLFFALLINVALITLSLPFAFTPVITCLMFLASLYLMLWEYPRWTSLLPGWQGESIKILPAVEIGKLERSSYVTMTVAGWIQTCCMRGILSKFTSFDLLLFNASFVIGAVGALMLLTSWFRILLTSKKRASGS